MLVAGDVPAVMFVRPRPGVVGERARMVHVVPVPDATAVPEFLTAYCGAHFPAGSIDLVQGSSGMPCVRCLARAPLPGEHEQREITGETDV